MKADDAFTKKSDRAATVLPRASMKEYGISREVINSISLYIYNRDYPVVPNAFEIYNDWVEHCGVYPSSLDGLASIIELIRKISILSRADLKKALEYDNFHMSTDKVPLP